MTMVCGGLTGDWHCEPRPYNKEDKANANFIIEACNNYESLKAQNAELLAALKQKDEVLRSAGLVGNQRNYALITKVKPRI